jgi:hypothetical protein
MRRRTFCISDSQQLITRARNAIRHVQMAVLPSSQQRIAETRELLSVSVGRELEAQQRIHEPPPPPATTWARDESL